VNGATHDQLIKSRPAGSHQNRYAARPPRHPEGRARAERDFETLNTRLWSTLPGYVNSNTTARNPSARAVLTPMELEDGRARTHMELE